MPNRIHTKGNHFMTERLRPGKSRAESQGKKVRKDARVQEKRKPSGQETKSTWQPPTGQHEYILSEPNVTLHVGNTPESYEAFEALDKASIHFRIVKSDDLKTPYTTFGEVFPEENEFGEGYEGTSRFEGVEGAKAFAQIQNNTDERLTKYLLEKHPERFEGGSPEFKKWMEEVEQRQREKNHAIMYPEENATRKKKSSKRPKKSS